jgi:hypothetical protein
MTKILDFEHAQRKVMNKALQVMAKRTGRTCKWDGCNIVAYDKATKTWGVVYRGF